MTEVKGLTIRALRQSDKAKLAQMANNREIWLNVKDRMPFPYSEEDALDFISMASAMDPQRIFGIDFEGELVGAIGLHGSEDVYRKNMDVGYWIGEPYWGRGFATAALKLICDYGFVTLNVHRIRASVFDHNPASRKVLENAGFRNEGLFKEHVYKDGRYMDEHQYGLLRSEYKKK